MSPGHVAALWRYPVKSMLGEQCDAVEIDNRGVVGDRVLAVRDPEGKLGSGKSSRRFRKMDGLLELAATYDGDVPVIAMPDGTTVRGDDPAVHDALSAHVGRSVRLAREDGVPHFDDGPVHLVTTSALAAGPTDSESDATSQTSSRSSASLEGQININTATMAELEQLPGVGPAIAERIVNYRKDNPFKARNQIMRIKGIGEKTFAKIKDYLVVEGETTLRVVK